MTALSDVRTMVPGRRVISGLRLGPPLPDEGPWQLVSFKGRVFAVSQVSGLYEVEATSLRKIDLQGRPDGG